MLASTFYERAGEMSDQEIREALGGQLCRCTGYVGIVNAVRAAGEST
jgi:aerobic carbon-monoxide dehydrogenase small subunit